MSYWKRQNTKKFIQHPNSYNTHSMTYKPYLLKEDVEQKIPLFLIKLWNIVESEDYRDVVRWDETGFSFHIMDPYAFCSNILPQYFKHKNLNSLVRQLNMYGFRKNTPIDRSGLARPESDQDHLEFMHPYFRRDHPELLVNIKRKVSNKPTSNIATSAAMQQVQAIDVDGGGSVSLSMKDLTGIFDELKCLRERQKTMDMRMEELTKENEMLWTEMAHVRGTHLKQQQIVNKLIQFLVALVGPQQKQQGRLGKRHMYVLEDGQSGGGEVSECSDTSIKRVRGEFSRDAFGSGPLAPDGSSCGGGINVNERNGHGSESTTSNITSQQLQSILPANASEILDRLINDITGSSTGIGGGNIVFGHVEQQKRRDEQHHRIHKLEPTTLTTPYIDELFLNTSNDNNNDHQLQPYTSGGAVVSRICDNSRPLRSSRAYGHGSASSLLSNTSTSTGPIIAEVTEEIDQLNSACVVDPFQIGATNNTMQKTSVSQQQSTMIASPSDNSFTSVDPGQHHQMSQQAITYRPYSKSFGNGNDPTAPPMPKRFMISQQTQPPMHTTTIAANTIITPTNPNVAMSAQTSANVSQPQQPMIVYQQFAPKSTQQIMSTQSQQPTMVMQVQQHHEQQQHKTMQPQYQQLSPITPQQFSPPTAHTQRHQMQPTTIQRPNVLAAEIAPILPIQKATTTAQQFGLDNQQHFQRFTQYADQNNQLQSNQQQTYVNASAGGPNSNSPLIVQPNSAESNQRQSPSTTEFGPITRLNEAQLTEGMMLHEHEIADIARLNAYLDENDARFRNLTNSIGEHWDNVGGMVDADDFQDLLDYGNAHEEMNASGAVGSTTVHHQTQYNAGTNTNACLPNLTPTNEPRHYLNEHHVDLDFAFSPAPNN